MCLFFAYVHERLQCFDLSYSHCACDYFIGGPGLEPPYRPRMPLNNPQKIMSTRSNYPGMISNLQGMMGMDNKQYALGFKPQPAMPQGQIRQQLQVRLVSLITDVESTGTQEAPAERDRN